MQHKLSQGKLLDDKGALCEAGYAYSLVKEYDRRAIKAGKLRIKEWDYYLIYNDDYALALTIDDNSYMGMLSLSLIDFKKPWEKTASHILPFTLGRLRMPSTSEHGVTTCKRNGSEITFTVEGNRRIIKCFEKKFDGNIALSAEIELTEPPQDSMVIATPFAEDKKAFYYNQKIIGMRASGFVQYGGERYDFDGANSFGLLDWGRGVWTYDNTWLWGAAQGEVNGHIVGFNIGYGFGDTSKASENMIFCDGRAHKLEGVTFDIPRAEDGSDDFMKPWRFTSTDNRFEMDFVPIIDRSAYTSLKVILSDQHQVFGRFTGYMTLDDGTHIELKDFLGFAEKVRNKW